MLQDFSVYLRPIVARALLSAALIMGGTSDVFAKQSRFTVLYTLGAQHGDGVSANVSIHDRVGNLYGTTTKGGANDEGAVFRLAPDGAETLLYSFCGKKKCRDGAQPNRGLVMDDKDNLYGATYAGGSANNGVVFKVRPDGKEEILHSFSGGTDGGLPVAGVIGEGEGNLYGTTFAGGGPGRGYGVVFKVSFTREETVLYTFQGMDDGGGPESILLMDGSGNLYGTTVAGGAHGYGSLFALTPGGSEMALYSFTGGSDGSQPIDGLTMDRSGKLFGTTFYAGNAGCYEDQGCGVVFELAPDGTETVLYSFEGGADGGNPMSGRLVSDDQGNLYGTTPLLR